MNGKTSALFDTNILIDYLAGNELAVSEIASANKRYISIISYIELLVGTNPENLKIIKQFLSRFIIISPNLTIADTAISLRQKYKLKLPDALILATAIEHNAILITRDAKDVAMSELDVRVPYKV